MLPMMSDTRYEMQVTKLTRKNLTFNLIPDHDASSTEARDTHFAVYKSVHKLQFHTDKWPQTEHMQIPSKYSV